MLLTANIDSCCSELVPAANVDAVVVDVLNEEVNGSDDVDSCCVRLTAGCWLLLAVELAVLEAMLTAVDDSFGEL